MLQTATIPMYNEVNTWVSWFPKRGEIYYCDLGDSIDSEQRGIRPVVIVSNNVGNQMGSIVVICPITSKKKPLQKIHILVSRESGLKMESYILSEHIRSISKRRFFYNNIPCRIGSLPNAKILELKNAIQFELGFAM